MKIKYLNTKFLSLLAFVAVFFIAGCGEAQKSIVTEGAEVGEKLSIAQYIDVSDNKIMVPESSKKVHVINLWATWCPPCREEMPELQKFYDKYKDNNNVAFYAINAGEEKDEVMSFLQKNNYSFNVVFDYEGAGIKALKTRGIPTTVVLDKDGIVVLRRIGPITFKELEDIVEKSIKK